MSMRVLVVGPASLFPWMGYTVRALRRLGCVPFRFCYSNLWMNRLASPWLTDTLTWVPGLPRWLGQETERWHRQREYALLAAVSRIKPDLILLLKGERISAETLQSLARMAPRSLVTWWVDDPCAFPQFIQSLPVFEHVFIFDRSYLRPLQQAGVRHAHFLPCACDETVFRPRPLNRSQRSKYRCDVVLVAWYYANRAEIVNALREFHVNIWGVGWNSAEAHASLNGAGRRLIRSSRFVQDERAASIYSAATIGLNIHNVQSRDAGLNARTFELLATGTFELTDAIPGMEGLLVPGREVVTYHSAQEARALSAYYLAHPQERARVASRGRARVLREHTYVHRMRQLLETVGR